MSVVCLFLRRKAGRDQPWSSNCVTVGKHSWLEAESAVDLSGLYDTPMALHSQDHILRSQNNQNLALIFPDRMEAENQKIRFYNILLSLQKTLAYQYTVQHWSSRKTRGHWRRLPVLVRWIMIPQRCPCPNPWDLWRCYLIWTLQVWLS